MAMADHVVMMSACCSEGPGLEPNEGNPKISKDLYCLILAGCYLDEALNEWALVPVSMFDK